jgi:hypothetical protein
MGTVGAGQENVQKLKKWGWLGAFLVPLVGLIIGIVLLTKEEVGTGIAQILVGLFMMDFWYGFMIGLEMSQY